MNNKRYAKRLLGMSNAIMNVESDTETLKEKAETEKIDTAKEETFEDKLRSDAYIEKEEDAKDIKEEQEQGQRFK